MAKVPGITAKHAIITPNCRTVDRGTPNKPMAAFDEAVRRLREEYRQVCHHRTNESWNAHLVLKVEGLE